MERHYFRLCFLLPVLRQAFTRTDVDLVPSESNIAETKTKIKHFSLQQIHAFETVVSQIVAILFGTRCSPLKCVKIRLPLQAIRVYLSVCLNHFVTSSYVLRHESNILNPTFYQLLRPTFWHHGIIIFFSHSHNTEKMPPVHYYMVDTGVKT